MSRFFEDLEAQLHGAARERASSRRQAREGGLRLGWLRTAVPVAMALSTTAAVVALALVLLGHHALRAGQPARAGASGPAASGPPHVVLGGTGYAPLIGGTPVQRQEIRYIDSATSPVLQSAVCRRRAVTGPPVLSQRSPSAQLLSVLGVLRAPAAPGDRLYPGLHSSLPPQKQTVYVNYIRLARRFHGVSFYLVPSGHWMPLTPLPVPCYDAQVIALHRALPHIPAALRAGTLALLTAQIVAQEHRDTRTMNGDGVCLEAVFSRGESGGCNYSASDIARWGSIEAGGSGMEDLFAGLVPDGVRSVTLRFNATKRWRALSVTGDVVGNVFVARAARAAYGVFPAKILWREANGHVIKIVTLPWA